MGCTSPVCEEGFLQLEDGNCYPVEAGDTGESQVDDSGVVADEWVLLEGPCEAEAEGLGSPLQMVWQVPEGFPGPRDPFLELIDLDADVERDRAYAVGQGGLVVYYDDGESIQTETYYPDDLQGRFHHLELLDETLLVVSHRDRGFEILDTSTPGTAGQSAFVAAEGASGMAYAAPYLYVLDQFGGLHTYNISTPSEPGFLDHIEGLGSPWEIVIEGDWGYVADASLGLVVLDLSNPEQPMVHATVETQGGAQDLSLVGDRIFLAVGGAGIETFSLEEPGMPVSTGVLSYGTAIVSVSSDSDLLWGVGHEDLVVLSVADDQVVPLAMARTPQFGMHVQAAGQGAYVADWELVEYFELDTGKQAPALDLTPTELYFPGESQTSELQVRNRGSSDLVLEGASVADDRFVVWATRLRIPPGEEARVRVVFEGTGDSVDTQLCLSTNDPSTPGRSVRLAEGSALSSSPAIGEAAEDFVGEDLEGNTWRLSEQLGKPVVLVYFVTW